MMIQNGPHWGCYGLTVLAIVLMFVGTLALVLMCG